MESLYLLIPVALLIIIVAVGVFFWAVKSGQYDDLNTEGRRILFDDEPLPRQTLTENPPTSSSSEPAKEDNKLG